MAAVHAMEKALSTVASLNRCWLTRSFDGPLLSLTHSSPSLPLGSICVSDERERERRGWL